MAALGNVSVTSAAIIEGSLIIGLSDGSIINCGYVQGPQGLKGDRGPTGSTGERGTDGATIHTTKGPPPADLGKDGDYAINNRDWFIFGPKASGMWGAGQGMLPKDINQPVFGGSSSQGGGPIGGSDSGGGGGGPSGPVFTSQVIATGSGRLKPDSRGTKRTVNYPGSANGIISPSGDMNFQSNINGWIVDALDELEGAIPVPVVDLLPDAGQYDGQLVLFEGSLYIWAGGAWTKVSADGGGVVIDTIPPVPAAEGQLWFNNSEDELTLYIYDGAAWVPASPPVSLDGINTSIASIDAELMKVNANIAMNKRDIDEAILDVREDQERQDEKIAELEGEVDDLKPTVERGEWIYNADPENKNNPEVGEYHAYVVVSDDYCKSKLSECLLNAAGDPTEASKCNRDNEDCLAEIGNIDTDVPWHDVEWLVVHRNDVEGRNHSFGDVVPGMYIEAINLDGTGHGLYLIVSKSLSPTRCGFQVTPVHSTGHPNGKAVVKIFSMAEAANPEEYVRKEGDTMTGRLTVKPSVGSASLAVYAGPDANNGSYVSYVYGKLINNEDGSTSRPLIFGITADGSRITASPTYSPTQKAHLATKEYVDTKLTGMPYVYTNKNEADLVAGEFCQKMSDNAYHCHHIDANGVNHNAKNVTQTFSGAWFVFKIFDGAGNKVVSHTGTTVYAKSGKYFAWSRSKIMVEERLTEGETYYLKDDLFL